MKTPFTIQGSFSATIRLRDNKCVTCGSVLLTSCGQFFGGECIRCVLKLSTQNCLGVNEISSNSIDYDIVNDAAFFHEGFVRAMQRVIQLYVGILCTAIILTTVLVDLA